MRSLLLAFILSVAPLDLDAETVNVTSGEHADFTRIVVSMAEETAWRFGRFADGYLLTIGSKDVDYDLSKVFERIPKSRLAEIKQIDGTSDLRITLSCPCFATAFAFRPSVLVVDIKNGQPPVDSRFEDYVESFHDVEGAKTAPQNSAMPKDALDWTGRSTTFSRPVDYLWVNAQSNLRGTDVFRESLTRQLASAASQGVIEIDIADEDLPESNTAKEREVPFRVDHEISELIRITGSDPVMTLAQGRCLSDDVTDLPSWATSDAGVAPNLADINRILVSDADPLPVDVLKLAARKYLFLGFGAEAKQLLSLVVRPSQEDLVLMSIADALERNVQDESPLAGMEVCDNSAALWSVLVRERLRKSEPLNTDAILRNFAMLPGYLRKHLASALIDRFLEQGNKQAAETVREILARSLQDAGAVIPVASARLDLADGQADPAAKSLEYAASRPSQDEPAALIALVDLAMASQERVPMEKITNLEALSAQLEKQPIASGLNRALVISYALEGEFERASNYLSNAAGADRPYWSIMAKNGGDSDILQFAFMLPPREHTDPETAFNMAERLAKLGFAEQALTWLALFEQDAVAAEPDWRLLRASQHLALLDARQALSTVAGLGAEADAVRASAMRQLDRVDEAVEILRRNPDAGNLLAIQRAERLWGDLAVGEDGAWTSAAQVLTAPIAEAVPQPITLQFANDMAASALNSRAALQELLMATELAQDGP